MKIAARCLLLAVSFIGFGFSESISHADDRGGRSVAVNIQTTGRYLETDWLLGIRMPGTGTSKGLVIRYRVSADRIVLQSLDNHPTFNFTSFPGHPRQLIGDGTAGSATFSNLRQRTVNRSDLKFGRRPRLFDLRHLVYDSRECGWAALESRATQQRLQELWSGPQDGRHSSSEVDSKASADWFREPDQKFSSGLLAQYSWKPRNSQERRVTTLKYEVEKVSRMDVFLPQRTLRIPLSEKHQQSIEVRYNTNRWEHSQDFNSSLVPVRLKSAPLTLLDGGRDVTVEYRDVEIEGGALRLPVSIEVRSRARREDWVRVLRFAKLLSARVVDPPPQDFEVLKREVLEGPVNRAVLYHGRHFKDGDNTDAARAAYQRVERELGPRPGQPFYHRLTYHGFYLSRKIRLGRVEEVQDHADQWLQGIRSSEFMPLFPECAHSLAMRVERSGSQQKFEAVCQQILKHAPAIDADARLDGCLHARNNVYCPWLLFRIGCEDMPGRRFSIDGLAPNVAFRRCYFAGSLIGRLIERLDTPPKPGQTGYYDEVTQASTVTKEELNDLRAEIRSSAQRLYNTMSDDDKQASRHHLEVLLSWTQP